MGVVILFLLIRFNGNQNLATTLVDILGLGYLPFLVNHTGQTKEKLTALDKKTEEIAHQTNGDLTRRLNEQTEIIIDAICKVIAETNNSKRNIPQMKRRILAEVGRGRKR